VNGEVRKLPAVPLIKDSILWLPLKPYAELMGKSAKALKFTRGAARAAVPAAAGSGAPETAPPGPAASPAGPNPRSSPRPTDSRPPNGREGQTRRAGAARLPPLPRVGPRERAEFAATRVALFARAPAEPRGSDPKAVGTVRAMAAYLEQSGFQVHELQAMPGWPAPAAVNALRPHVVFFLECSPRSEGFWVYHPAVRAPARAAAAPSPEAGSEGLLGPTTAEASLSRQIAERAADYLVRYTGVQGRSQGDANLLPVGRVMAASVLVDFPAKAGAAGSLGETVLARSLHDALVASLGARAQRSPAGTEHPAVFAPSHPEPAAPASPVVSQAAGPVSAEPDPEAATGPFPPGVAETRPVSAPATDPEEDIPGIRTPASEGPEDETTDQAPMSEPEDSTPDAPLDIPGGASEGTYTPLDPGVPSSRREPSRKRPVQAPYPRQGAPPR
ncbi:MAG: hypothetical protein HY303_10175, partial [Candidatus Wallbacteria bacterium]|nr:hypothetical protein [Candidatus Wallbacteria bacterium]